MCCWHESWCMILYHIHIMLIYLPTYLPVKLSSPDDSESLDLSLPMEDRIRPSTTPCNVSAAYKHCKATRHLNKPFVHLQSVGRNKLYIDLQFSTCRKPPNRRLAKKQTEALQQQHVGYVFPTTERFVFFFEKTTWTVSPTPTERSVDPD